MSIRDASNLPDHMVPDWVKRSREYKRAADSRWIFYNEKDEQGKTAHERSLDK